MDSGQHLTTPGESSRSFQASFERLLERAPGPIFPRARRLYFSKYSLEGNAAERFRTFLLEEEIQEGHGGTVRVRAVAFAVVHWMGAEIGEENYATYLRERWGLEPADLIAVRGQEWFRGSGAYARFTTPAVQERSGPTALLTPSVDPDDPGVDHGPNR
jgi:hypothetical protein